MDLDEIDRKILRLLVNDSQIPLAEMSAGVGLSPTALHHRIKNLKRSGVIKRYTITISEEYYQSRISCFVSIIKDKKSSIELARRLKMIKSVEACYSVTGEESLLVKIRANSTHDLQDTLEAINRIDGVSRTLTSLIIEEHFDKGSLIL